MIREARQAKGWNGKTAAERIGIPAPHLSQYETGGRVPTPDKVARIAAVLGIDPDLLEVHFGRAPEALRRDPLEWALVRLAAAAESTADIDPQSPALVRREALEAALAKIVSERDRLTCIAGKIRSVLAMAGGEAR